jgi:predicted HTH transcriptional regulator
MNLEEILNQPEGRRLEFKEALIQITIFRGSTPPYYLKDKGKLQGTKYPTNALILFSDDPLRNSMFHYAKVECARFKGVSSDEFIDQKSITTNIATQAEEAYNFVLRHINKGATVEGVYTVSRWEYPVKAIREVIRNAVCTGIIRSPEKM